MSTIPHALEPVGRALLEAAREDAARTIAAAREDAEQSRLRGAAETRTVRDDARDRGRAEGRLEAETSLRHARRASQGAVLAAEQEAYAELRRRVLDRLRELHTGPDYPGLLEHLRRQARAALGPDARVTEAAEGGVVAEAEGRLLALTLPALGEQALLSLGPELEGLWRR